MSPAPALRNSTPARPRPPAPRPPRWHRRKDARPAEILEAALAEFVQRGFAATRIEDIARRAGVTKGTVYLYFANKEALFKAMTRHSVLPSVEAGEELLRTHRGTARELVAEMLRTRWGTLFESSASGIPKLLISEAVNFPELARWYHDEIVARANAALASALNLGIERGEFRALDVNRAVMTAVAPVLVAALWKHSFMCSVPPPFEFEGYIEEWIDTFLRGIECRGARE